MPAHPVRAGAAGVGAVVLLAAALVTWTDGSGTSSRAPVPVDLAVEAATLPTPRRPAFELGWVPPLPTAQTPTRWAPVLETVSPRAWPSEDASVVGVLEPRTSLETTNIVLVVGHARVSRRLWVRVQFPGLPNNRSGWLPRETLGGYQFVRTRLLVDLGALSASLLRDGRTIFRASVGVGAEEFPTPRGSFYIREKLTSFDNPFYGPVAFGTSARSGVLTDWPDGGSIGIHGTNRPDLLPGRVSHGCIRMENEDILRLSRLMPVGTPVTIT
jgi:L,D-transpeptidase catalytic domain